MATLYKRGKAYRVQFRIKGKQRSRQFKTRRAASKFRDRLSTLAAPNLSETTVADMCQEWHAACKRGRDGLPPLEPETLVTYRGYIDNWLIPALGVKRVGGITQEHVRDFRDEVLGSGVERITAKKILGALKSVLAYAKSSGEIEGAPGHGITVKLGTRTKRRIDVFELEEVRTLLDTAQRLSEHTDLRTRKAWVVYYPMVRLLTSTGMRISELRGLPRRAHDYGASSVSVTQRADKAGRIGPVKSAAGQRTVFIPEQLNELLKVHIASHNHDLVFPSKTGRSLDAHNIGERMWKPLLEEAGVRHRGIHTLRHFYASRLIAMGESIKEVSADLGHADEAFTLTTYGHLFRDRDNVERRKARAERVI